MQSAGLQWGFIVSFLCSLGIVLTTKWHGRFTLDGVSGVQKFHIVPTPRIGGVAIMSGLVVACAAMDDAESKLLASILLAGLPAFCFGLAEDITKRVSVRTRLLATMASGGVAWLATGASVLHVGVPGLDNALSLLPVSVMFTAFAVGGVANAVNIIDGFNGLASGAVSICLLALGLIARNAGDTELSTLCMVVCLVTLGFFALNFPFGKLFLGDGGAYLLGFLLAWLSVMLAYRNPSVSVWAPLMACAYPIYETVFTIVRRVWTRSDPGQPDSHHLHSLVKIGIVSRLLPNMRADLRNASVAPFSWAVAAVPAFLSVRFANRTGALLLACLASFGLYLALYWYAASASKGRRSAPARIVQRVEVPVDEALPVRRVSSG